MVPTFVVAIIFYKLRIYYLSTSRSIKRLEGVSEYIEILRLNSFMNLLHSVLFNDKYICIFVMFIAKSPVFAYLSASLQGLTTIRAYEAELIMSKEFDNHQVSNPVFYLYIYVLYSPY